uniref:Uncharacterized protein n=1 Tax=Arundo donax TaxID=35708 RepID=A0A0A9AAP8_ARUDO
MCKCGKPKGNQTWQSSKYQFKGENWDNSYKICRYFDWKVFLCQILMSSIK